MKSLTIDACRWHVDAEAPEYKQRALDHFRDRYLVLLAFMREYALLRDPTFGMDVRNWYVFEIHSSDLTEEGLELVRLCHGKWNPAFGQGHTQKHLTQWKRKLNALRQKNETITQ